MIRPHDRNRFKFEWTIDFDRGQPARLGGIEDWMLMRRLAVLFSVVGSLCAAVLVLAIGPFDSSSFATAYMVLAIVTICFALVATFRVGTVMKFETGPRFLDIPRLSRAFYLAALLIVPCVLLQIGYPLKLVFGHQSLTAEDVNPIKDLVNLYDDDLDRNIPLSIPVSKSDGQDSPSAHPNEVMKIVSDEVERTKLLLKEINDDFDAIDKLGLSYPIATSLDVITERGNLQRILNARIADLTEIGANPAVINEKIKFEYEKLKADLQSARLGYSKDSLLLELAKREKTFPYLRSKAGLRCKSDSQSAGCRLFDRFVQLWMLRQRSFGRDLFPAGLPTAEQELRSSQATENPENPVAVYVSLFGWQGVLPVLIIASTFGAALRIIRLTDKPGFYVFCALAIAPLWSFAYTPPSSFSSPFEDANYSGSLLVTIIGSAILWVLMLVPWSVDSHTRKRRYPQERLARATMLVLPTALFLPLFFFAEIGFAAPVDWLVAPVLLGVIGLIVLLMRRLDSSVVELNCKPRMV